MRVPTASIQLHSRDYQESFDEDCETDCVWLLRPLGLRYTFKTCVYFHWVPVRFYGPADSMTYFRQIMKSIQGR
jgi:hypothetical protein